MTRVAWAVALFVIGAGLPLRGEAARVTWTVSGLASLGGSLAGFVSPSPFAASITFESTTPSTSEEPGIGRYETALLDVHFDSGGFHFEFPLTGSTFVMTSHSVDVRAGGFQLLMIDVSTDQRSLPIVPPISYPATTAVASITVTGSSPEFYALRGVGPVLYSVPEPGVVVLLLLAGCAVIRSAQRGRG